jgi:hypothetical protein
VAEAADALLEALGQGQQRDDRRHTDRDPGCGESRSSPIAHEVERYEAGHTAIIDRGPRTTVAHESAFFNAEVQAVCDRVRKQLDERPAVPG